MEGDTFDFKCAIKSRDPKENDNTIQTACSFANTKGGFIIFGVCRNSNGRYEIKGLDKYDNYAKEFGDKIKSINPTVYFVPSTFIPIPESDKVLIIMHIPLSQQRPHMIENGSIYCRTNKGNEIMNYNQVKEAFLGYEERRHKLRLLYVELLANNNIASDITLQSEDGRRVSFGEFNGDVITNLLADIYPVIQNDKELLRLILELRIKISQTNSRIRMSSSFALDANLGGVRSMSAQIDEMIKKYIVPTIEEIKKILESRYGLHNPFAE